MTRLFVATAFLLGATAIVWMGLDFAGSHTLAFTVTAVIGAVYLIGIMELLQFRRATATLAHALLNLPPRTGDDAQWLARWLTRLDPSLRSAVKLRIEGERVGLPAPVFTPYLVGLLVMLGLLGTFVGMVDTLGGAVLALQGSTELDAVRAGLAAPIQGLGVAFGTSVAGVAASAMLGLISTLVRRDRMLATRQLEEKIATDFHDFSLAHHRQRAFDTLQAQANALPAVAATLQQLAAQLALTGDRLGATLVANQVSFHESTGQQFMDLAKSVDKSLQASLAASGKAAGESMRPLITEAMATISRLAQSSQEQLAATAQAQLRSYGDEFKTASAAILRTFDASSASRAEESLALQHSFNQVMAESTRELSDNARETSRGMLTEVSALLQASEALVQTRIASEAAWLESHGERMEQLSGTLSAELGGLRDQQEQGHAAAVDRLGRLESAVADHISRLGNALEQPMSRLIETASETPRAAAEVIGQLRAEISNSLARDNELLAERQQLMAGLSTLSGSLEQATTGQREAVASLVESSASLLQDISARLGDQVATGVARMADAGDHLAGSAHEISSLGEAFGVAVDLFHSSNQSMIEHLTRVEESMARTSSRSDEQLAYYVAQAREIIDYSMLSQQAIMEDLRRLNPGAGDALAQQPQEPALEAEAS